MRTANADVFRVTLQVFCVMLQVFRVILHVFPVMLQETPATLQETPATVNETHATLHAFATSRPCPLNTHSQHCVVQLSRNFFDSKVVVTNYLNNIDSS